MNRAFAATSAFALSATGALAAGVERSTQSAMILYETGNYVELNFARVKPEVSGTQSVNAGATSLAGVSSGNMTEDFTTLGLGLKFSVNDKVDLALIIDEPIGAEVFYRPDTGYLYGGSSALFGGSTANLDSTAVTALAKYSFDDNYSVFGGLRVLRTGGDVSLFQGYTLDVPQETDYGYVVGAAYERPDIALRVALTYNSAIKHDFDVTERVIDPATGAPTFIDSVTPVEIPQSLNLEFQSGVAEDTLVFGSIRYVDWTEFNISPDLYINAVSGGRPLVDFDSDTVTWTLGVGRRFTPNWSGAVFASYEDKMGGFSGNLGPTDGQKSIGVAVTYEQDSFEITAGARYVRFGDTTTEAPAPFPAGTEFARFEDNDAVAWGLKIAYKF